MSALTTVEVQGGDPLVVEVILPAEQVVQVVEVVTGVVGAPGPPGPPGPAGASPGALAWQTVFAGTSLPVGTQGLVLVENGTGGPITITLPPTPEQGHALTIKDGLGNASAYPITVSGPIEDKPSLVVRSGWGWLSLTYNGAQWLQLVTAPAGPQGLPGEGFLELQAVTGSTTLANDMAGLVMVQHSAPVTIGLPASPSMGQLLTIKDAGGNSATWPITVTGGVVLIDGAATFEIAFNWSWVSLAFTGVQWGQV